MTDILPAQTSAPVILVIGSDFACGKSVFACGVAGALREHGFSTRVIKPLILTSRKFAEAELSFLGTVGQTPIDYPIGFLDRPYSLRETNWLNTISRSKSASHVTFVELPGAASTPVCYEENNAGTITNHWRDTADMAQEFQQPAVVVARHQNDSIERLVMTVGYLQMRGIVVFGAATVEVVQDGGAELERKRSRADFTIGFSARTSVPYLGCIKYSQAISVPRVMQGNLIKMTAGVDLLPILKGLDLAVPTIQA